MKTTCTIGITCLIAGLGGMAAAGADEGVVSFASLLDEMVDRDRLARLPEPAYTCRQASSYDRRSVAPDDPEGWQANCDWSHFVRSETTGGRTEWVMLEADGPGCVVRIWSGGPKPKGTIRFYLDGAAEPAIEAPTDAVIGGTALVGPPLSAVRARGLNLYLPIPYARHCKITYDGPNVWETNDPADRIWYNINYRTYPTGTRVESFTRTVFEAARDDVQRLQATLVKPAAALPDDLQAHPPGNKTLRQDETLEQSLAGPAAVRKLRMKIEADDPEAATRSTVLCLEFDGRPTAWCPVGDFFGSGAGVNPFRGWWRTVDEDGWMTCYWVMPYQESCNIEVKNLAEQEVKVTLEVATSDWTWDDRSMHFHTAWRQQYPIDTSVKHDWNYVEVTGQGVFVGDTLALVNPVRNWWGEGDEKIYVDGEAFPSHFGTGSEDYYGYAWGTPELFGTPFHAQPRVQGPANRGHTTNTRSRGLDAIPFQQSFRLDIEVWHWASVNVAYAAASHWYARPGASARPAPDPSQARLWTPEPLKPLVKVEGAVEGETAKILEKSGGITEIQDLRQYRWSGDRQLWWRDGKPGDQLVLAVPVEKSGRYAVKGNFTKAVDYGIFQLLLDGKPLGEPVDFYNDGVVTTGEITLGVLELTAGQGKLTVRITGANAEALKRHMLGLDYLRLEPAD